MGSLVGDAEAVVEHRQGPGEETAPPTAAWALDANKSHSDQELSITVQTIETVNCRHKLVFLQVKQNWHPLTKVQMASPTLLVLSVVIFPKSHFP